MTLADARNAIGHSRPAWVETATGHMAILIRASRPIGDGDAVLIRYAYGPDAGYHWTNASELTRRADCDLRPEPTWLQQARVSPRPPAILHDILNPDYSDRALTGGAK